MIYVVYNYGDNGQPLKRRETTARAEADAWARETPRAGIDTFRADGEMLSDEHYSAKHPPSEPDLRVKFVREIAAARGSSELEEIAERMRAKLPKSRRNRVAWITLEKALEKSRDAK